MEEHKEYWFCIIGPATRSEQPCNGEGPLRMAVEDAFYKIFDRDAEECASGFGMTEEEKNAIEKLQAKQFQKRVEKYTETNDIIGT